MLCPHCGVKISFLGGGGVGALRLSAAHEKAVEQATSWRRWLQRW
jgi:hypothetical protein